MIEAYKIGVALTLKDLVAPELLRLSQQFTRLELQAKNLSLQLKGLNVNAAGLRDVMRASTGIDASLGRAARNASALNTELKSIRAGGLTASGPVRGVPQAGRAGGTALHGGALHVGPAGLGVGTAGLAFGVPGAAAVGAVGGSAYAGKRLADAAGDLQLEVIRFKALGVSEELTQEALKVAKSMSVYGSSVVENMRMMRDVQAIFREPDTIEHARAIAPVLAQMNASNRILFGDEFREGSERRLLDMTKVIELRTGTKPELFKPEADYVQKSFITSGGRVGPEQYMKLIGRGANAVLGMDPREFYFGLEPVLQMLGGDQTGTGMATAYQRMVLGRGIDKPAAELMGKLGLLKPGTAATPAGVKAGGFAYSEMFTKRPIAFLYDVLLPALEKAGITSPADVFAAEDRLLGKTGGKVYGAFTREKKVIQTSLQESQRAMSIDQITQEASKSFEGAKRDFLTAWTDFKTAFGERILPQATELVKGATTLLRSVDGFIAANKGLIADVQKIEPHALGGPVRYVVEHAAALIRNGGIKAPLKDGEAAPLPRDFNFVNAGPGRPITIVTKVELDRRQIAEAVTGVMSEQLQRAPAGGSRFDPTMGPVYPSQALPLTR